MRFSQRLVPAALALLFLLTLPRVAAADTFVSGTLSSNTTWTIAQSPIVINSTVIVPAGITLTIQPGVTVRVASQQLLSVRGTLIARGTAGSRILFTSTVIPVTRGFWGGIEFLETASDATYGAAGEWTGGSVLEHVIVEGAGSFAASFNANIYLRDAWPLIDSVTLRDNYGPGVMSFSLQTLPRPTMKIRNSEFIGRLPTSIQSETAINIQVPGDIAIENNIVRNFGVDGVIVGIGDPADSSGAPVPPDSIRDLLIAGNRIYSNLGRGLEIRPGAGMRLQLRDNQIHDNGTGVWLSSVWSENTITMTGNIVRNNHAEAVSLLNDSIRPGAVTITHNVFTANGGAAGGRRSGLHVVNHGPVTVTNNVFNGTSDGHGPGAVALGIRNGILTFSNNLVDDNVGNDVSAVEIRGYGSATVVADNNTVTGNLAITSLNTLLDRPAAIVVDLTEATSGTSALHGNNIFGNATTLSANRYALHTRSWNLATTDATGNWWGTSNPSAIDTLISPQPGELTAGRNGVDTGFPLTSINTDAPISSPRGVVVSGSWPTINLTWSPNPEGDVAGYRVWYGPRNDPLLRGTGAAQGPSPIDVGNVTSFQLTNLPSFNEVVKVTAYDTQRDGVRDQTEGHESAFAPTENAPLEFSNLIASRSLPQGPSSTPITFTASAFRGRPPYQFKFEVWDGSFWSAGIWSDVNVFSWTPLVANPNYRIRASAKSINNLTDSPDNARSVLVLDYPITSGPLTASITSLSPSPQPAGTQLTFFAYPSVGVYTEYEFKWRISTDGGGSYSTFQDWSIANGFSWRPMVAVPNARINVWLRPLGSVVDAPTAETTLSYVVTGDPGALTLASITSNLTSPSTVGTTITFTANATGGTAPVQYKWWIFDGTWQVARDWSTDSSFSWTPTTASTGYRIGVWLRSAGSTADTYDNPNANGSITYTITTGALTITSLTSNLISPQPAGTSITFVANAAGGTVPRQFKWLLSTNGGASFVTAQDWSASNTFTWTPAMAVSDARISVWARNSGVTADAPQAQATVGYSITAPPAGPLVLNSIGSSMPSPQAVGTVLTFTAHVSGGTTPWQFKWWLFDGTWRVLSDWNFGNGVTWTPTTPSSAYRIAVWVRSAGNNNDTYDNANSNGSIGYTITAGATPLTVTSLTPNVASPQASGTPITFAAAAAGGTPPYQYKWRVSTNGGTTFTTTQDWGSNASFTWTPASPIADARINVWVRNSGVTADAPQAEATMSYVITTPSAGPLVLNSITSNVASPQQTGTTITFTANASGGTAPYQYKWWLFNGAWNVVSNWSTSSTFTWAPATASSAYRIGVWVRSAGNSNDTYENANSNSSIGYTITAGTVPPLVVTSVTRSHLSPQPAGTTMTFTANATGGIPPYQYRWRMSTDGGNSFFFPTAWSDSPTFVWTPSTPFAEVRIQVMVRNFGNTSDIFDVLHGTYSYEITAPTGGPLALNSITSSAPSPQTVSTPITFTANASGGTGPYQYKWWLLDGAWNVVSNWSTSSTFTWTPTTASNAYRIAVWVRNAGNTNDIYENANSNGSIGYVITAGAAPLTVNGLTANAASPQPPGTTITFSASASGGTAPYQFKWRLSTDGGTSFTTVQDWSSNASFAWTPGSAIADARMTVWARNSGVTADVPQAQSTIGYVIATPAPGPLVLNSIVPDLASPRTVGTSITFTANASGGTGPYQYKWWIFNGSWQAVQNWSTDNTFRWTPTTPGSTFRVGVWVRNAGSTTDSYDNANANGSIGFVVLP